MNPTSTVVSVITSDTMDPFKVLASFNFWLIAVVNFALVLTIKQTLKKIKQAHLLDIFWADIVLGFLPLIVGACLGTLVLDGYSTEMRALIGLTAGFLNPFAFKLLEKVAPTWVVSAYDPVRNNGIGTPVIPADEEGPTPPAEK